MVYNGHHKFQTSVQVQVQVYLFRYVIQLCHFLLIFIQLLTATSRIETPNRVSEEGFFSVVPMKILCLKFPFEKLCLV